MDAKHTWLEDSPRRPRTKWCDAGLSRVLTVRTASTENRKASSIGAHQNERSGTGGLGEREEISPRTHVFNQRTQTAEAGVGRSEWKWVKGEGRDTITLSIIVSTIKKCLNIFY